MMDIKWENKLYENSPVEIVLREGPPKKKNVIVVVGEIKFNYACLVV